MKKLFFIILSFSIFYQNIGICQEEKDKSFEGQIYLQFEERSGYAIGDFTLKKITGKIKPIKWESRIFEGKTETDEWVDDLNKLGDKYWKPVCTLYYGFGIVRILITRPKITNDE